MAYRTVDPREVEIALERIDGAAFEKFAQQFYGASKEPPYVPLGGVNDGGAEGFDDAELFADERLGSSCKRPFKAMHGQRSGKL